MSDTNLDPMPQSNIKMKKKKKTKKVDDLNMAEFSIEPISQTPIPTMPRPISYMFREYTSPHLNEPTTSLAKQENINLKPKNDYSYNQNTDVDRPISYMFRENTVDSNNPPNYEDIRLNRNQESTNHLLANNNTGATKSFRDVFKNITKKNIFIALIVLLAIVVVIIVIAVPISVINSKKSENKTISTTTKVTRAPVTASPLLTCSYVANSAPSGSTCLSGYSGNYCDECGLSFRSTNLKVLGGVEASPNSWPSVALIRFKYKFIYTISNVGTYLATRVSICGGTLINRRTVITSASCYVTVVTYKSGNSEVNYQVKTNNYYSTFESMYTVYLGVHNIQSVYDETDVSPGAAYSVSKFILHPDYDSSTSLNDIAVIKLTDDAKLNCYVQIACLPDPTAGLYPTSINIDAWAAGWGKLSSAEAYPYNLYNTKLTVLDTTFCDNLMPSLAKDWSRQICAGSYLGGKNTCKGDTGGPLYLRDEINGKQEYIFVGIVSNLDGCSNTNSPGIFSRVSYYLNWINSN